jgi:hypothetical protein
MLKTPSFASLGRGCTCLSDRPLIAARRKIEDLINADSFSEMAEMASIAPLKNIVRKSIR